tara:strand:+ start:807 stop:1256 length:450 start_codon:yes stop_codon:yes gene_type:complete
MSSAVSNSSARRRRSVQPKVQERIQEKVAQEETKSTGDYQNENVPILGVKESIYFLSNKIRFLEAVIQKETFSKDKSSNNNDEITKAIDDIKRTVDDFSIKFGLLEVSVGKLNLIVGIHDNYINKIKNMVDFDNIEKVEVQEITPKLIE